MVSFDNDNLSNEEDFYQEEPSTDDDIDLEVDDGSMENPRFPRFHHLVHIYEEGDENEINEENIPTEVRGRELRNMFRFLMNHQQCFNPQILSSDNGTVIACPFYDFTAENNQIEAYNSHLTTHDEYTGEQLNVIQNAATIESTNREIEMLVRHVLQNANGEDVVNLADRLDVDDNQVMGTFYGQVIGTADGQVVENRITCQECGFYCYNLIDYTRHVEIHGEISD